MRRCPQPPAIARAWLEDLQTRRRLSPRTLAAYRRDIDALVELTGAADDQRLVNLDSAALRTAAARLHSAGLAPASIARTLSAWRGLYGWLALRGFLVPEPVQDRAPAAAQGAPAVQRAAADPTHGLRAPRRARLLPRALAPDQAVRFVAHATDGSWLQARDQALVELMYSSGLRLAEVVGLDWRHFAAARLQPASSGWLELDQRTVTVCGKGGRSRSVPVGRAAAQALGTWLDARAKRAGCDPRALFVSSRGTRLACRSVQARVAHLVRRLGFEVPVHPHVLRHSMASHVLQSSGDLRAVQELLGHVQIATTQVYTRLDWQHLARAYDAAHPRAHRTRGTPGTPGAPGTPGTPGTPGKPRKP